MTSRKNLGPKECVYAEKEDWKKEKKGGKKKEKF